MSPTPVNNSLSDQHPKQGNEYLVHIETGPAGNYKAESFDPQAIMRIDATVTGDGNYSAEMYDADGTFSHTIHNGHKHSADSHTTSVTNHKHTVIGQGHAENIGQGHFEQNAGTKSQATNGPAIHASQTNPMTLSPGGHGIHALSGDQSYQVNQGGMYYSVDQGYSVNAKGSMNFNVSLDSNFTTGTSEGHVAGQNISFNAGTMITLTCGSSVITMTPSSITITAAAVFFTKA